jgi:hypothetical protein
MYRKNEKMLFVFCRITTIVKNNQKTGIPKDSDIAEYVDIL